MNFRVMLFVVLLALAAPLSWAQGSPAARTAEEKSNKEFVEVEAAVAAAPAFSERNPRYQLCPGDSIDLKFAFNPEFDQASVVVQPDGFVSVQAVGDLHVAGLTVPEVAGLLEKTYTKILNEPQITVTLRDFNKPYFIASGQVGKPGKYDLRANTTLTEAIAIAGGFLSSSKHSEVWLFRRLSDGKVESKRIDVKQMLAKGNLTEDIRVQPGDTVYVPQNAMSKVKGVIVPSTSVGIAPRF